MFSRSRAWLRGLIDPRYNLFRLDYWFGQVDSRPLSLFRICFGALLLKNALYSLPLAQLFYSDAGIVPRAQFWEDPAQVGLGRFSLLNYLPATWMALLFFAIWAVISLALLLGYQTRLMAVLNYLCKLSILYRNPFPLSGADHVITVLSFWMIFLPLNHDYAVDGWLARRRGQAAHLEQAAAALPHTPFAFPLRVFQIQVALIYIFTSYMKWQGVIWRQGDALHYTFQQNGYLLPTGMWLGEYGPLWLLRVLTWSTLLIEAAFPVLVFLPLLQPWARVCGLVLAAAMHLGIAVTMSIPDFSIVMWISYILFFEPSWVRWLECQARRLFKQPPPRMPYEASPERMSLAERTGWWSRSEPALGRVMLAVVLTVVLVSTIWGGLEEGSRLRRRLAPPAPAFLQAIDDQVQLASAWKMFIYPIIPRTGWVMVYGQFENGEEALLYSGADPASGQMYRLWGPGARLRLLEQHLLGAFPSTILRAWGTYYCRLFNSEQRGPARQHLSTLEIHMRHRWSHLPGAPANPYEDDLLWRHQCLMQ
jgi:hypothetical protein